MVPWPDEAAQTCHTLKCIILHCPCALNIFCQGHSIWTILQSSCSIQFLRSKYLLLRRKPPHRPGVLFVDYCGCSWTYHAMYVGLKLVRVSNSREAIIGHNLARCIQSEAALWDYQGVCTDGVYNAAQPLQFADQTAWWCTFSRVLQVRMCPVSQLAKE